MTARQQEMSSSSEMERSPRDQSPVSKTREARDEAGVTSMEADPAGPGRFRKDFGFYLKCIRLAPTTSSS